MLKSHHPSKKDTMIFHLLFLLIFTCPVSPLHAMTSKPNLSAKKDKNEDIAKINTPCRSNIFRKALLKVLEKKHKFPHSPAQASFNPILSYLIISFVTAFTHVSFPKKDVPHLSHKSFFKENLRFLIDNKSFFIEHPSSHPFHPLIKYIIHTSFHLNSHKTYSDLALKAGIPMPAPLTDQEIKSIIDSPIFFPNTEEKIKNLVKEQNKSQKECEDLLSQWKKDQNEPPTSKDIKEKYKAIINDYCEELFDLYSTNTIFPYFLSFLKESTWSLNSLNSPDFNLLRKYSIKLGILSSTQWTYFLSNTPSPRLTVNFYLPFAFNYSSSKKTKHIIVHKEDVLPWLTNLLEHFFVFLHSDAHLLKYFAHILAHFTAEKEMQYIPLNEKYFEEFSKKSMGIIFQKTLNSFTLQSLSPWQKERISYIHTIKEKDFIPSSKKP